MEREFPPSNMIAMDKAWGLVALTREQANAYFYAIGNAFESDMDIRQAFLQAADLVLTAPLPPVTAETQPSA